MSSVGSTTSGPLRRQRPRSLEAQHAQSGSLGGRRLQAAQQRSSKVWSTGAQVAAALFTVAANSSLAKVDVATLTNTLTASQALLGKHAPRQEHSPAARAGHACESPKPRAGNEEPAAEPYHGLDPQGHTTSAEHGRLPGARIAAFARHHVEDCRRVPNDGLRWGAPAGDVERQPLTKAELTLPIEHDPTFDSSSSRTSTSS